MTKFKTVSLADQVFEKLENDIITGVYPKGELLTELKLVEQLGVSRTPIREALRRLEQERLVSVSGKGIVVQGITVDDLLDIMQIRERIEGLAAFYAAKNASSAGIAALRQVCELQDFYYNKHDLEHLLQVDNQFHDVLFELSGRTVIQDTLIPLHRKTQRYRKLAIEDDMRLARSVAEHCGICQAVAERNPELAEQRMMQHIKNATENMIERFADNG